MHMLDVERSEEAKTYRKNVIRAGIVILTFLVVATVVALNKHNESGGMATNLKLESRVEPKDGSMISVAKMDETGFYGQCLSECERTAGLMASNEENGKQEPIEAVEDMTDMDTANALWHAFNLAKNTAGHVHNLLGNWRYSCGLDDIMGHIHAYLSHNYNSQCKTNTFGLYPEVNPIDLSIASFAIYRDLNLESGVFFNQMAVQRVMVDAGAKEMIVLDGFRVLSWAVMLLLDTSTNHLWVIFRGTALLQGGWIHNIVSVLLNHNVATLDGMRGHILNWRNTFAPMGYQIYGFAGHSNAGLFLQRVLVDWKVWRIAIDGGLPLPKRLEAHNGETYVNLRAMNDAVSIMGNPSNEECLSYCWAGHGSTTDCFKQRVSGISNSSDFHAQWCAVYSGFCGATSTLVPATPGHGNNMYLDISQFCPH